jgi:small subunit ribosomal protein S3Ae
MVSAKGKKKKGGNKKKIDPLTRKDWYTIKVPGMFVNRNVGWTLVNRTHGKKIASEALAGRIFNVSLADLNKDEDQAHRIFKLKTEDVQGRSVLTNFYGMDMTRDKLCSLIKKWQTLIEANVEVTTTDGYRLRLFCIGFTKKQNGQNKKTCYAQASQIRAVRAKMVEIMTAEAQKSDLKELVNKFIPESIGLSIEKACQSIYPLQNVYIRKCKMLKAPKFDLVKLMELHNDTSGQKGAKVERDEETAPVAGSGGRY